MKIKSFLFAAALAVAAFGFTSCEKCKDCTAEVLDSNNQVMASSDLGELCGDDLEAVDGETIETSSGGITIKTRYTCD